MLVEGKEDRQLEIDDWVEAILGTIRPVFDANKQYVRGPTKPTTC